MGLKNYIFNKISHSSNIIETVNVLAKLFLAVKSKNLEFSNEQIYQEVVKMRYKIIDLPEFKKLMITSQISPNLKFEQFIYAVLMAELDIHQTLEKFRVKVFDVVREELKKYPNLPK